MRYRIKDQNSNYLGDLKISDNTVDMENITDSDFKSFLSQAIRDGITGRRVSYDTKGTRVLYLKEITTSEDTYELDLIDFIARAGYAIEEVNTELDEEITRLLAEYSGDEDAKKIILSLAELSHLQKTYLLKQLKE